MGENDNGVNIKKKSYHHGDLRSALIAEGLRLLAERDAESLSLREVARAVGVSATSVYRHFPDKEALMTAVALQGLAQLGAAQRAAAEAVGGGDAGFAATGRAYVRFALANPALFRLIFASPALAAPSAFGTIKSEANSLLQANAAAAAAKDGGEAAVRAVRAWALVHGLAMLMLDGQIAEDDSLIDATIG
jgi:AcrR family transcriptional regulator